MPRVRAAWVPRGAASVAHITGRALVQAFYEHKSIYRRPSGFQRMDLQSSEDVGHGNSGSIVIWHTQASHLDATFVRKARPTPIGDTSELWLARSTTGC
jgi:hypothetical protein